jgi:non-canonical purine NTP pyrophosphatase (RdgB/HAM1 family)
MKINFITGNSGKIVSLQNYLKNYGLDYEVIAKKLDLVEPQANTVNEVSKSKALQTYTILKEPVICEDGGFYIEALNNFPGVYVRYILDTIGVDGILKLLEGKTNRFAKFCSCTTYIDKNGKIYQFENDNENIGVIALAKVLIDCPNAWSDLWFIYKNKNSDKVWAELTEEEWREENKNKKGRSSIENFVFWLKNQ